MLAPVANGADGQTYNVNADTFAGAIAGALKRQAPAAAHRRSRRARQGEEPDPGTDGQRCAQLIADGTISGGMIPKVETCIYALEQGVEGVVILDGKIAPRGPARVFTDHGAGTLIHK